MTNDHDSSATRRIRCSPTEETHTRRHAHTHLGLGPTAVGWCFFNADSGPSTVPSALYNPGKPHGTGGINQWRITGCGVFGAGCRYSAGFVGLLSPPPHRQPRREAQPSPDFSRSCQCEKKTNCHISRVHEQNKKNDTYPISSFRPRQGGTGGGLRSSKVQQKKITTPYGECGSVFSFYFIFSFTRDTANIYIYMFVTAHHGLRRLSMDLSVREHRGGAGWKGVLIMKHGRSRTKKGEGLDGSRRVSAAPELDQAARRSGKHFSRCQADCL